MVELLTGRRTAFFVGSVITVDCTVTSQLVVNARPVSTAEFRRITSTGRCTARTKTDKMTEVIEVLGTRICTRVQLKYSFEVHVRVLEESVLVLVLCK